MERSHPIDGHTPHFVPLRLAFASCSCRVIDTTRRELRPRAKKSRKPGERSGPDAGHWVDFVPYFVIALAPGRRVPETSSLRSERGGSRLDTMRAMRGLRVFVSVVAFGLWGCGGTAPSETATQPTRSASPPTGEPPHSDDSADTARPEPTPRIILHAPPDPIVRRPHFAIRSIELDADARLVLNDIARTLRDHPDIKVVHVIGNTDATEPSPDELSLARAKAVVEYLTRSGVDASRLRAEGKGDSMPMGPNQTVEGRESNRRVDFQIERP